VTPRALAGEISRLAADAPGRMLLGIAGAPGSGKSTLSEALVACLPEAALLPMDGFHLDDRVLNARGHRPRKGAPHTFDVAGFASLLQRARVEADFYAPAFDRDLEVSRGGALVIPATAKILIVEGNYLLHDDDGWDAVRPLLDQCWFLDVPMDELERRLSARWLGYDFGPEALREKLEGNDLPNARLVAATAARADRILRDVTLETA